MPQVFQVLCCYNCEMFQVQFVKKSNKWQCKVCNKKQSLKKAFKIGSAPECRSLVQQLNMQRGCQKMNINAEEWEETDNTITEETCIPYSEKINEKGEHVDQFTGYNKSADDMWSEDDDSRNDRFFPDSLSEFHYENSTSENNFVIENILPQTSEVKHEKNDVISSIVKGREQHKPVVCDDIKDCDKQKKRHLETCTDICSISSPVSIPHPFKKNRGFQLIRNAALKLS